MDAIKTPDVKNFKQHWLRRVCVCRMESERRWSRMSSGEPSSFWKLGIGERSRSVSRAAKPLVPESLMSAVLTAGMGSGWGMLLSSSLLSSPLCPSLPPLWRIFSPWQEFCERGHVTWEKLIFLPLWTEDLRHHGSFIGLQLNCMVLPLCLRCRIKYRTTLCSNLSLYHISHIVLLISKVLITANRQRKKEKNLICHG